MSLSCSDIALLSLSCCFVVRWEESCRTLMPGHKYFYELAIEHQALMINVEHRFYGDSFPFKDTSTTNLQYLSALQVV